MVRKSFSFWLNYEIDDEAKLLVYLDSLRVDNFSLYIKELLEMVRTGKLIKPDQEDLQRKKLLTDIKFKEVMIKIKEQELIYKQTFEQNPPPRHRKVMKVHIENQNPTYVSSIDEKNNRIMCPECGACFVFALDQHDANESKEKFIDHYFEKHGELSPQLQKELADF